MGAKILIVERNARIGELINNQLRENGFEARDVRHGAEAAIALRKGDQIWERCVESRVQMKNLSDEELNGYLATNDWQGKAGGYSIQGPAGAFIPWISGSHAAIMGLPLVETAQLLTTAGWPVWRQS